MPNLSRRALFAAPATLSAASRPHVVFVCGDHEYSGESTMPILAAALERHAGFRATVLRSQPDQNAEENIPGLDALAKADLAVFFLRWRRLPEKQLRHIDKYIRSGRPIFGFRTSSHSFNYPKGHPLEEWNRYATHVFGAPPGWGADGHTHFGHKSSTDVAVIPDAIRHPILRGVDEKFHVRSWLYRVLPKWPPPTAERLLEGVAVNPNTPAEPNPVAWTWKNPHNARVFFTTLGHPEDFQVESVQRLTWNAIHWCLQLRPKWPGKLEINVPYRGIVKSETKA
ncbi:MAG: ThuA domain-containing protein [Bryobacteraceae bacterium]